MTALQQRMAQRVAAVPQRTLIEKKRICDQLDEFGVRVSLRRWITSRKVAARSEQIFTGLNQTLFAEQGAIGQDRSQTISKDQSQAVGLVAADGW